jgi:hypothetical protein
LATTGVYDVVNAAEMSGDRAEVSAGADDDRSFDVAIRNPQVRRAVRARRAASTRARAPSSVREQEVVELAAPNRVADSDAE